MKKLLLLFTMSAISICSFAQATFGIKSGVNLASMSYDAPSGTDRALHPLLTNSFVSHIELSYSANLTLELGLVQTGSKLIDEENSDFISETYNNVRFSPGIAFNASDEFSIGVSPYISYLLSGTYKIELDGETDTETLTGDDFDDEQKLDYGLNINLNYLIDDAFLISAGYSLGLKDYNAHDNEEYDLDLDPLTNSGIMISIGYFFGN